MDISFYLNKRNYRIAVPRGVQRKIAVRFEVGKAFVCQALRRHRNSKLARCIRNVAMEEYGGWEEKLNEKGEHKRTLKY